MAQPGLVDGRSAISRAACALAPELQCCPLRWTTNAAAATAACCAAGQAWSRGLPLLPLQPHLVLLTMMVLLPLLLIALMIRVRVHDGCVD